MKDGTGAALPGVTVEASSPALIERARSVVTDGAGQYRIIDLSPGTYDVTFTIAGFKPIRRAGIILAGQLHRAGQHRARGRQRQRNDHGYRRDAGRRRGQQPRDRGRESRDDGRHSDRDAQPAGARLSDSRHDGDAGRIGPDQHDDLRIAGRRSGRDGGRHAAQPARRAGTVQRHLPERRHGAGDFVRHRRAERRSRAGRPARQHDSARRRQQFKGIFFIQGANGPLASDNRSDEVKGFIPAAAWPRLHLRDQPVVRRTDQARQALVLFHLQAVGHQELHDAARSEPGHAAELAELQLRDARHVAGDAARQVPLLRRQADERPALRRSWRHDHDRSVAPAVDAARHDAAGEVDADHDQPADARSRHHDVRPQFPPRAAARCRPARPAAIRNRHRRQLRHLRRHDGQLDARTTRRLRRRAT